VLLKSRASPDGRDAVRLGALSAPSTRGPDRGHTQRVAKRVFWKFSPLGRLLQRKPHQQIEPRV
jgi:hypothetical protein